MNETKKRILVAAHMGTVGGNIPGNTRASFEIALRQGADIIELDITKSADGKLFVFHPGTEKKRLGMDVDIRRMDSKEIEKLHFVNPDMAPTAHTVAYLADMLDFLRDRCIINLDKFFDNPAEISSLVHDMKMQDQVYIKTPATMDFFDKVAEVAGDIPYMPVVYEKDECFRYLATRHDIRCVGVEAVFSRDDSMLASDEYIEEMHRLGRLLWINSIRFSDASPLAGSRCDDNAMCGDPDEVWGWMAKKGFDIIQTDWTLPLCTYLRMKGY